MRPRMSKAGSAEKKRDSLAVIVAEHPWLLGVALVILTLIAYARVTQCGYIWDDNFHVTENPTLRDLHGLRRIWTDINATPQYYPLVHTSFWIEYHLWALNPVGYHVVNVALHALAGILLWRVLRTIRLPGAWLAAAIFAVHPVMVESVAWVTERKNVLSTVFYFGAALSYLRFDNFDDEPDHRKRQPGWYFIALGLFVCALLSKTVACSLSVALLLIAWWKSGTLNWRKVLPLLPFFAIGLLSGLGTVWIEKKHVGAEGAAWSFTILERMLIAGRALWFYAAKLVWPAKLTFIYPRWAINLSSVWQWLFSLGIIVLVATLWLARRRIGSGPLLAILFFVVALFPALGFIDVYPFRYSFVADHFQYVAAVGLIALAATGLTLLPRFISLLLLATLAALTWQQIGIYRDLETLWRDTIAKNPNSWMAQVSYAAVLLRKGQPEEALSHLRIAEQIDPNNAETQDNIGRALIQAGKIEEALSHFRKALELQPAFAAVNYDLGNALLQTGTVEQAIPYLQEAITRDPTYLLAYNDLGHALLLTGRAEESLAPLQAALKMNPNYTSAHFNIANTLLQLGRADEAMAHLREVLSAHPRDPEALKNMAWILATSPDPALRDGARAVELAESARNLGSRPDPIIEATLAAAYAEAGRFSDALATAGAALQLAKNNGQTSLAQLLQKEVELYQIGLPFRDVR